MTATSTLTDSPTRKMRSFALLFPVRVALLTTLAAHAARGAPLSSNYLAGCGTGRGICLPSWEPTWDMYRSTLLYTCNTSGMHDVNDAVKFGTVVYDWSNAKEVWANGHPMNSEELITK